MMISTDILNRQAYELFMQAPVAIAIIEGPEHTIILANDPVLKLWGKGREIIGKPVIEGLPEIAGQGFIELLNNVKRTGEAFYANEHATRLVRDGKEETIYLNFVYKPFYDEDGMIPAIMAIATDVTAQVLARRKIEYAEETSRLAIESAELGTYEVSLITDETITSQRFNSIWGYDSPVPRAALASVFHKDDWPKRMKAHEDSLKTGKLFYEGRVTWKDDSIHWVKVNGTVLFDTEGQPVRLIGVAQDITEQKAFAEEMKRLVNQRTTELQEANDMLGNSNRELEQFAYITSHDLQEPLRKIQIYADLLNEKAGLGGMPKTHAEKIASSARRMSGLIHELLDYARLTQTNAQFKMVDLNQILTDVLSDFELLITQKKATVNVIPLETILAIPLQINQLFFNLIGNALKFNRKSSSPVISITGALLTDDEKILFPQLLTAKKYYKIEVADNGIGFEQEYASKIFAVFQRLNLQSEYGGYGIGLALCGKVVANHNGLIFAKSNPGTGAVFTVILPYDHN